MAEYLGSITLASVEDGESGEGYIIESNHDFIYRAQTIPSTEAEINKIFSPDSIIFKVYTHNIANPLVPRTDYYYNFYYLGPEFQDANLPILLDNVSEVDSQTNSVLFRMANIRTQSETNNNMKAIYESCLGGDAFFAFYIYEDALKTNVLARYAFYVQNMLSASLASFEVTATNIQALVDKSALVFDTDGLTVYNGSLTIYNEEYDPLNPPSLEQRVFYFDAADGLHLTGSGTFSGNIYATDGEFRGTVYASNGSFTGEITAQSGTIGGFQITSNALLSTEEQLGGTPNIRLYGSDGSIYARNITLGESATIEKYIQLGQPSSYEEEIFEFDSSKTYYEFNGTSYIETSDTDPDPTKTYYILIDGAYESVSFDLDHNQDHYEKINDEYVLSTDEHRDTSKTYYTFNYSTLSYIYNPLASESHGYFLQVGDYVSLTATGILNLNRIVLDGINSTIKGTGVEQDPNFGWPDFYITPEKAYFRNVDISGKISTMVFEVGHTQAVGGSMLFKPSYKVTSHSSTDTTTTLVLDSDPTQYLEVNKQYIILINDSGSMIGNPIKVSAISTVNVTIDIVLDDVPMSMVVLGEDEALIIGINSTDAPGTYLRPRGITISEFEHTQTSATLPIPKVYIGDLSNAGFEITGLNFEGHSYGLYSSNVILNGSLTTQVDSNTEVNYTYAGVNTLSQVSANKFSGEDFPTADTTKIVFWAGSRGVQSTQIQESPFQVTERGSIYAQNGLFEGVIIARSKIKGVDIYAARIHGAAKDTQLMGDNISNEYGLAFYDTAQGIVFKTGGDDDEHATKVFSINSYNFETDNGSFITINSSTKEVNFNGVDFNGINFTATNLVKGLQLQSLKDNISITIGGDSTPDKIVYSGARTSYVDFYNNNGEISFSNGNSVEQFTLNTNSANFNVEELHSIANFQLGATPGQGYMRYKKVSNGYDLFI